jgi:RIO kinase 1
MKRLDDYSDDGIDRKRLHHRVGLKKTSQGVFDDATLMTLYELSKRNVFDRLSGIVSQGKEANVYHGFSGKHEVAVKIYCVDACDFRRMSENIVGDPRFSVGKGRRKLVYQWAHREFRNLKAVHERVSCPKPYAVANNVLVMEFIGRDGVPAQKLKDVPLPGPRRYFDKVVKEVKKMYACGVVHGDLSEYNILDRNGPVLIDYSMGVTLKHPLAKELLRRDVENVIRFFGKHGVEADAESVLREVAKA